MKKKYKILIGILMMLVMSGITYFDGVLYQEPIMIVKNVKQTDSMSIDDENRQITQEISGIIINRNLQVKKLTNQYTTSQMTDFKVHIGQELILNKSQKTILNIKKDYIVVITVMALILLMTLVIPSFLKNIGVLIAYFLLYLAFINTVNQHTQFILPLSILIIVIVLTFTAMMLFGRTRQTIYLMGAIGLALIISLLIGITCLKANNFADINFELSGAGLQPYLNVFIVQVIFGVAGVILDETIDITASMKEIADNEVKVTQKQLYNIGMKIGRDLIGPLSGILFFIIIANHMNEITVYLSNNYPQKELFKLIISPDIAQFLISVLGITLAVPITSYIFSHVLVRRTN